MNKDKLLTEGIPKYLKKGPKGNKDEVESIGENEMVCENIILCML